MQIFRIAMKVTVWMLGIVACLLFVLFAVVELMIGLGVENFSRKALAQFQGDRIVALIAFADCQNCKIEERNHAVWALGQLRDKRSLPILYKYRTGEPCNHRTAICQYEIHKAIRWTERNSYMAPQLWRILLTKERPRSAKVRS
jgi:hypothetical protein